MSASPAIITSALRVRPHFGGASLRKAFIAGSNAVIAKRDLLNKINVFPVADGDTGTNLAFTFAAVREAAQRGKSLDAAAFLHTVAMAAIDGARGNSGAIVAQFFYGLSQSASLSFGQSHSGARTGRMSLDSLIHAISAAAKSARSALAEPREGTILSVMQACATALQKYQQHPRTDWRHAFYSAKDATAAALKRTPQQLAVLAEHGVVDAGAQGFLYFWEGVCEFAASGKISDRETSVALDLVGELSHGALAHDCQSRFRYCSECLLKNADINALHRALVGFAHDSLVIAGGLETARLHAHCDDPAELFARLSAHALVSARKADDMQAQVRARSNPAKVVIVCDTAADLPPAEVARLFIQTVHVRVNFGADEFIDKITMSPRQFYQRLQSDPQPVRTSQPPTGEFRRLFDQLASLDRDIICLNVSSKLSGTWQAAKAASAHGGGGKACVVDTLNAATGQALLVLDAAEAAAAGLSQQQILQRITLMRPLTRTMAMMPDLSYGVRGGRIPKWVQRMTDFLQAKVLVANTASGMIKPRGVLWGQSRIPERFARWALREAGARGPVRVIVGHCNALAEAEKLVSYLRQLGAQITRIDLVDAGTAIGAHAGPGSLVLGVQPVVPL
jgi:uncharacterized protein